MSEMTATIREQTVELPTSAPMIRVTAGFGSAGQKTWNLRRPITVVGSRRPAHIVLHDSEVSNAHCVIINTGAEVLIKDLHTSSGTWLNKKRIDLATVKDGDVVTLGETQIQVAIHVPESVGDDSACGLEFADPLKFPSPVRLQLVHTDKQWELADAVVLLGRHDDSAVRLDHSDVSSRHAVLFKVGQAPVVFDLGSRTGLWVNGQRCSLTPLSDGDRLTVGPFGLAVQVSERGTAVRTVTPIESIVTLPGLVPSPVEPRIDPASLETKPAAEAPTPGAMQPDVPPAGIGGEISSAWDRLNTWRTQVRDGGKVPEERESELQKREAEVEARDAALRGQLHDVTRLNDELLQRERDLAARAAQVQAETDVLQTGKTEAQGRDAELQRREAEIQRRENAVTQRWSRLASAACPHCRKPINLAQGDAS